MICNRPRSCYKLSVPGFTLIELLVVVLIIGILDAIAFPQYQKTVRNSKFTEFISVARRFVDAEEEYYLINDKYARNISDLIVLINHPSGYIYLENVGAAVEIKFKKGVFPYIRYNFGHLNGVRKIYCYSQGQQKLIDICGGFQVEITP